MEFVPAVRQAFQRYVDLKGRASRSEYWWFILFTVLVSFICGILDMVLDSVIGTGDLLLPLGTIALLVPSITVAVRRLHDLDRSGWWVLLGLIPVIGEIILIVWFATPGSPGPNRYGGDPLGGQKPVPA
ncbi:putative inner membrane protein [Rhodovastum atsumiense]|uniref:DUF805 domain-containing protein n=1 Tax=Rhodovastum atsumiense TaxID=504468 RepID=A0A5M6J152_9PROT|nr:DUF805 domain-containing protein [Rhodovastum atsumiense]KAA5613385.1 DUF805 domain-containing protein [Rhodovastum atsumiense]CAH2603070.1 putative inner membrane protein [Rhodovastum atsumiense]